MRKTLLSLALLFSAQNLFGAYEVKIAVYKDHANLMTYISKISEESYRKNIRIEEKNNLHYATSTLYENETEVNKALSAYKKVFPDAFIVEVEKKMIVPVPTEAVAKTLVQTEEIMQTSMPTEVEVQTPEPMEKEQVPTFDAKMLLENKTVYICNERVSVGSKNEVVKMDFKKDYVIYSKLKRDVPPIQIPYTFDKDCVILPMSGIDFKYQIYQEGQDFLSAQSFIEDKKGHHLRYYFDEDLALEFAKRP